MIGFYWCVCILSEMNSLGNSKPLSNMTYIKVDIPSFAFSCHFTFYLTIGVYKMFSICILHFLVPILLTYPILHVYTLEACAHFQAAFWKEKIYYMLTINLVIRNQLPGMCRLLRWDAWKPWLFQEISPYSSFSSARMSVSHLFHLFLKL